MLSKLAFVQLKTVHSLQHWEKHQENSKPRQLPQSFSVPAPSTTDVGCNTQRCNDPCLTTMMLLSTSVSDVCHIETSPAQPTAWRWVMQSPCSGMWVSTSPSFGGAGAAWGGHTAATVGSCCLAQAFLQDTSKGRSCTLAVYCKLFRGFSNKLTHTNRVFLQTPQSQTTTFINKLTHTKMGHFCNNNNIWCIFLAQSHVTICSLETILSKTVSLLHVSCQWYHCFYEWGKQ